MMAVGIIVILLIVIFFLTTCDARAPEEKIGGNYVISISTQPIEGDDIINDNIKYNKFSNYSRQRYDNFFKLCRPIFLNTQSFIVY